VYQEARFGPLSVWKKGAPVSDHAVTFDELAALAAGELTGPHADRLRAAALASPGSAGLLAALEETVAAIKEDDSVAPPASVVERVRAMMPRQVMPVAGLFDHARTVLLDLLFDSRREALVGLRSPAAMAPGFHARFGMGEVELDVRVEPESRPGLFRVSGQVDPPSAPDSLVLLLGRGQPVVEAATDAHGYFSLTAGPGEFSLAIDAAERVFLTPAFQVP
jgi:hypothetical protein